MNKPWKTKTCKTCESRVGHVCRLNPPVISGYDGQVYYPCVLHRLNFEDLEDDDKQEWASACSKYEEVS